MVNIQTVVNLALSFPETDEHLHFDRRAFRVKNKIFATLSEKDKTLNIKLSPEDQSVFCRFNSQVVYPVPGGWGRHGWTTANLRLIRKSMLEDILTVSYCSVAPPKLGDPFRIS